MRARWNTGGLFVLVTFVLGCADVRVDGAAEDLRQRTFPADVVSVGYRHACVVEADGDVRCWGANDAGQVGDGAPGDHLTPVLVAGMRPATGVAAGALHTCALAVNGVVQCWGSNANGQLGNGSIGGGSTSPTTVVSLTHTVQVATGAYHSCALAADGTVRCWGWGGYGQTGTTANTGTPMLIGHLFDVVAIAAGDGATCALRSNGTVACWGQGYVDGRTTSSTASADIAGINSAVAIEVGGAHACAVLATGVVRCWGYGSHGELGVTVASPTPTPVGVPGVTTAVAITAGQSHTCTTLADGSARCWGTDLDGELGNGTTGAGGPTPVDVSALSMATGISAGNDATCAIRGDGTVRCWGRGTDGQLGNGLGTSSATPVLVSSAGGALARARIAAGWYTSCALTPQGSIYCWGRNQDGELGIGTSSPYSTTPVQVPFLYAADVAVGVDHVCALRMGSVSCWGNNDEGQLGTGDQVDRYSPTFVPGITQVVAITAGYQHTCALVAAGNVWCWGRNLSGQIGDGNPIGTVSHYLSPIRVGPPGGHPLGNVVTISARAEGTCAVLANGTVQCWGLNSSGQLGDGTTTSRSTPAPVLGLSGVTAISAAGIAQACVVLDDGQARCWGDNGFGQLGDGTSTSSSSPVAVANVTHAVDIAVHGSHACVLQSDARVWCWGNNTSGQLGNGTTIGSNVPVLAGNPLTTVVSLVAGQNHTCIVHVDGSAQCWGDDAHGELGVGDTAQRLWPTDVVSFP